MSAREVGVLLQDLSSVGSSGTKVAASRWRRQRPPSISDDDSDDTDDNDSPNNSMVASAAQRIELIDTTQDGLPDTLAVDTVGDGVADTMIRLHPGNGDDRLSCGSVVDEAVTNAAKRIELIDTTQDGVPDTLAIDTVGDGIADTMIKLGTTPTPSRLCVSIRPSPRWSLAGTWASAAATRCRSCLRYLVGGGPQATVAENVSLCEAGGGIGRTRWDTLDALTSWTWREKGNTSLPKSQGRGAGGAEPRRPYPTGRRL